MNPPYFLLTPIKKNKVVYFLLLSQQDLSYHPIKKIKMAAMTAPSANSSSQNRSLSKFDRDSNYEAGTNCEAYQKMNEYTGEYEAIAYYTPDMKELHDMMIAIMLHIVNGLTGYEWIRALNRFKKNESLQVMRNIVHDKGWRWQAWKEFVYDWHFSIVDYMLDQRFKRLLSLLSMKVTLNLWNDDRHTTVHGPGFGDMKEWFDAFELIEHLYGSGRGSGHIEYVNEGVKKCKAVIKKIQAVEKKFEKIKKDFPTMNDAQKESAEEFAGTMRDRRIKAMASLRKIVQEHIIYSKPTFYSQREVDEYWDKRCLKKKRKRN